jgi:hypothetical protein
MRRRSIALALVVTGACGGSANPLYKAGSKEDDGHGELAQASSKLIILEDDSVFAHAARRPSGARNNIAIDDDPGGDTYGGDPYGGNSYDALAQAPYPYGYTNRVPRYNAVAGLTGAIEGTITWRGAVPGKRTTACGALDVAAIGPDRGVGDVLVYIEQVHTGRTMVTEGARAASVGGLLVKRNCALVPTVQIMTPIPTTLSIHGDAKPAKLRVQPPKGSARTVELEAAGRMAVGVAAEGVTRVDGVDAELTSAWVHALETTYYAITDDHGRFRIDELAPGTYELTIWHAPIFADGKYGQPIVVKRTVKVDKAAKSTRVDVAIGK